MAHDYSQRLYMITRLNNYPVWQMPGSIVVRHGDFAYFFKVKRAEHVPFRAWLKDKKLEALKLHASASVGG